MLKSYREEKTKLIPGDTLEIDGKKRTVTSWIVYDKPTFTNFLRENHNFTVSQSVQAMLKNTNANTERENTR
jgi:hypothetical protein